MRSINCRGRCCRKTNSRKSSSQSNAMKIDFAPLPAHGMVAAPLG
jgi:hypothetical protein